MREQNKSQAEVGQILGVGRKTIDDWESMANTSNGGTANTCTPDLRFRIPADHYERIYNRVQAGEPEGQVAADYRVTQQRVSQIVQLVEARQREPEPVETPPGFPKKRYRCLIAPAQRYRLMRD